MTPEERAVIAAAEALYDAKVNVRTEWDLRDEAYQDLSAAQAELEAAVRALRASRGQTPENTYTALEAEGWEEAAGSLLIFGDVWISLDDDSVNITTPVLLPCPDEASAVATARALARIVKGAP